jgi:hypothetical protein
MSAGSPSAIAETASRHREHSMSFKSSSGIDWFPAVGPISVNQGDPTLH